VESHFYNEDFLKVRTPNLVPSGAMEASLHPFSVEGTSLQLPTSPEFALKKLWLSGEFNKIFEVSASFRAQELGTKHLSEFTMLEFYMAEASFLDLVEQSQAFFKKFLNLGDQPCRVLKMNELFSTYVGFELQPDSTEDFLRKAMAFHGLSVPEGATWADLFHLLLLDKIEPVLSGGLITIVNYPPQLAALARLNSGGWAERVEFYYKGLELGNGYNELLDPDEILRRWSVENDTRKAEGLLSHDVDEELIEAHKNTTLKSGVGVAVGLERLFWLTRQDPGEHIDVWPFGGHS